MRPRSLLTLVVIAFLTLVAGWIDLPGETLDIGGFKERHPIRQGLDLQVEERLSGGSFDPVELALGLGDEVLLVGHDPDFSDAIARVTGARVKLKKGGLAAIGEGELHLLVRPRELKAIAN